MAKFDENTLKEVATVVEKATPHKIVINEELNKSMRFLRQSFTLTHLQDLNKNDDGYKEEKIRLDKLFRTITEAYCSPMTEENCILYKLIKKLSDIASYMQFVGDTEILDAALRECGMTIKVLSPKSGYGQFDETTAEEFKKLFTAAKEVRGKIKAELSAIKEDIWSELPDNARYDSKTNKSGIKAEAFNRLTALEAAKQKSQSAAEKKLEALEDSIHTQIDANLNTVSVASQIANFEENQN